MMRKTPLLAVLALILLLPQLSAEPVRDEATLHAYFDALTANDMFMGTVLVEKDGEQLFSYSGGSADMAAGTNLQLESRYHIGSISKTFTATLVMIAAQEGELDLSSFIDAFFPTLPNADKITIRELLNHHSGVHNFTASADYLSWRTQPQSREALVDIIAKGGSDFAPGERGAYSNSNYVLLSFILEDVYKQPYGSILRDKIIEPLGLEQTSFGPGDNDSMAMPCRSYAYVAAEWAPVEDTDPSVPMGAGGVVTTAADLTTFINALYSGKLVSERNLRQMETQTDGYGMGMFKVEFDEHPAYMHNGQIDGFNSIYFYFPDSRVSYVLLSNGLNYPLPEISRTVLGSVFGEPVEVPQFNSYHVEEADLEPYLGHYTSDESPLVIDISHKGNTLLAHPVGQPVFTMEATAKDKFLNRITAVTLEFSPSDGEMVLHQGTSTLHFKRADKGD